MEFSTVRRDLVVGMIDLLVEAIELDMLDEAENIRGALQLMRPQMTKEFSGFGVWILIRRGYMDRAMQALAEIHDDSPMWHAMMALCLHTCNDPAWQIHAEQVMQGNDESSKMLIRGLRGEKIESEAVEEASDVAVAVSQAAPAHKEYQQFLRI